MNRRLVIVLAAAALLPLLSACEQKSAPVAASVAARESTQCGADGGVAVQVLGSGGPIADDSRASTGYIVWIDGKARALIDSGGGTFLRFAQSGARFEDLDFIGLSHLHADHSADFPAIIKSANFSPRTRSLSVGGPDGGGAFPGLADYMRRMLGDEGAYAYLSAFLDGSANKPMLTPREVPRDETTFVYTSENLNIDAMHVPHGPVPAVAFRVRVDEETIVFASDQNGSNPLFPEFAKDAGILVMHMVVPEDATGVARRLHAPPSLIGGIADQANARKLVLSHFMARSLADLDGNVELVRQGFGGEVVVAEDLACVPL
jgi:ribonuclease BN (tRNA processing enzyme)